MFSYNDENIVFADEKSLAFRLLTFAERSFLTLADGAKYSLSNCQLPTLQLSTKANCRYPPVSVVWISAVGLTSRRRQLESVSSPVTQCGNICESALPLDERLYLAPSASVTYFIGVLPVEVNNIIAREPEEQASDYEHIKEVLLKKFTLSAEKFQQLLVKTHKNSEATGYDFYHYLKTLLDGWLKIETFGQLRDLMLVDQIKRRAPKEFKEHFLDEWVTITSPKNLVGKIEEVEDAKKKKKRLEGN
ncbi:retrovirus-related Pol polyprotein from transposon 17.6 [Trichonephila clavipes]|nr:retrovirus-related Pol polyprotein from transposon 17.6 [Trichonephila clavipes]